MKYHLTMIMKTNRSTVRLVSLGLVLLVGGVIPGNAASVSKDTPLHLQPDADSPPVGLLLGGSTVTPLVQEELAAEGIDKPPAGWVAIRYYGPVTGYAPNASVGKDFTLKPGTMIRAAPSNGGLIFSMIAEGETAEVTELAGDWSKVIFDKNMILFLNAGGGTTNLPAQKAPAEGYAIDTQNQPASAATAVPSSVSPGGEATPRVFQGYLTRTQRFLGRGPKLDYQLVDGNNTRIALLDLSALLLTDPIDRFEGRQVGVFGVLNNRSEVKDVVIRVETIRLVE